MKSYVGSRELAILQMRWVDGIDRWDWNSGDEIWGKSC